MKLKTKIVLSIVILITVLAIGTVVHAANFTSRVLGASPNQKGTYTSGTVTESSLDPNFPHTFSENNNVGLTKAEIIASKNLFCVDRRHGLGEQNKYKLASNEIVSQNNRLAYILSENENNRQLLADGEVQKALWYYLEHDKGINQGGISANDLYNAAIKFEEYRNSYIEPAFTSTNAETNVSNGQIVCGPYSVTYNTSFYSNEGTNFERQFGQITNIQLVNAADQAVNNWYIADRNKVQMNTYPESMEQFYIIINSTSITEQLKLKIAFNDIRATGRYYELAGTYTVPANNEEYIFYCDDCRNNADQSETLTQRVTCGNTAIDEVVDGEVTQSHTYYCKIGSVSVPASISGTTGDVLTTQTKKCGESYSYSIKVNGTTVGSSGGHVAVCGGHTATLTYTNITTNKGCGRQVNLGVNPKTGQSITGKCGSILKEHPSYETDSQELYYGWGERTTGGELEININTKPIDIALRKFITKVNGTEVSSRVPEVDTTPLKTGASTTANYNHRKDDVRAEIGDLVDYTIRVYNEGELDAYANEITDYIAPELQFIYNDTNISYKWRAFDNKNREFRTLFVIDSLYEKIRGSVTDADETYISDWYNVITGDYYKGNQIYLLILGLLNEGVTNNANAENVVKRWYNVILDRVPNADELNGWVTVINQSSDPTAVIMQFLDNEEAQRGYVRLLYRTVIGREPDAEGLNTYSNSLINGYYTRADLAGMLYINYANNVNNLEYFSSYYKEYIANQTVAFIKTSYGYDTKLLKYDGGNSLSYRDVKVTLKVRSNAQENQRLINIAEITDYAEYAGHRDSAPSNFYGAYAQVLGRTYAGKETVGSYVKGQEDDDDFEAVIVGTTIIPKTVTVKKVWEKINSNDAPEITVYLKSGSTTIDTIKLNKSNNWEHTWNNLDGTKTYTVDEDIQTNKFTKTITQLGDSTNTTYVITNTQVTTDIPVEKKWVDSDNKDNLRPTKIVAVLKANGTEKGTLELNAGNNWKGTFKDLPKYDASGKEITYTVNEKEVPSGYVVSISGTTITNTEVIDIPVEKIWVDANNKDNTRSQSVTVHLYAGTTEIDSKVLSASNNWKHTFTGLAKYDASGNEIKYDVKEDEIEHYVVSVDKTKDGNFKLKFAVTNTEVYDRLEVEKIWVDNENHNGKRPGSVTIYLYKNGGNTNKAVTLSATNNWKGSFTKLPKYDVSGNEIKYSLTEEPIKNGNKLLYQAEIKETEHGKFVLKFKVTNIELIDMGGTVWLDGEEGKQQERNGKLDKNDTRFKDILVALYRDGKPVATTKTDSNGNYKFTDQLITGTYKVVFEYGGQEYIPVAVTELNSGKYTNVNSAGAERGNDRTNLNSKFYEIVNGTAKNSSGTNTVELSYKKNSSAHTSSIDKTTNEFVTKTKIQSSTVEFVLADKKSDKYIDTKKVDIEHINLGLVLRDQVNLGIMSDVGKVELAINGQTYTYDYNKRDEKTAIDLNVKLADYDRVYNQAIYKSDYNFRISDYNDDKTVKVSDSSKELEAYITYKVKVKNYSSKTASVSGLKLYYDSTYKYISTECSKANVSWTQGAKDHGYNTMTTSSLKGVSLAPNEDAYVYVKFQVLKDNNGNIRTGTKYIITEITGYTSTEGLIDINSEPGNVDISNLWNSYKNSMEDDTDRAPGLNIYVDDKLVRTMTGFVFEDDADKKDSDGVKIGDGAYDGDSSKLRNNAIVQLVELVTIDGKEYEYIWEETTTGSDKVSYMDRNGKLNEGNRAKTVSKSTGTYTFTDYIPGNYIVRFKYGEIKDNKNIVALSGQDYKSTENKGFGNNTSSADDNKARRWEVMQYSIEQSYEKSSILSNTGVNAEELIKNTKMNADTARFVVGIADKSPATKINLGLIKRPIAELDAQKTVTRIKITNGGHVLADTDIKYNASLEGTNKEPNIEIDNELINGAVMEISYNIQITNKGEKDTLWNYFKGDTLGGKIQGNQHEGTKTTALLLFDYPQNIGFDVDTNKLWEKASADDLKILSAEVQDNISKDKKVLVLKPLGEGKGKLYKELSIGDKTEIVSVTLNRVLSIGQNDQLLYNNMVEIVTAKNTVGRRAEKSIYGNYKPSNPGSLKTNPTEPDSDATSTTVTDPTGLKFNPHYEIWISVAGILILGIVLIKVTVLRKKD